MSYPWTAYKTWVTGEVLTAGDLNSTVSTSITNSIPTSIDDYSSTTTVMRTQSDPYPLGAESLATTLAGELERLRYSQWKTLQAILGSAAATYWYQYPGSTLIDVFKIAATGVAITPTSNQLVLGTTRTVTLTAPTPASASRTVTLPDLTGDYSVVGTIGAQTITGVKTFSGTVDASGLLKGKGTVTNDSPSAGYIGEVIQATASASFVNYPATTVYGDLTSINLTAGDWVVSALLEHAVNGATVTRALLGISATTGNSTTGLSLNENWADVPNITTNSSATIPLYHVQLAGSATYYLKYSATFSAGTPQATGRLTALRIR